MPKLSAGLRMAYVWGWPLVNMIKRSASITTAPEPGRLNGVLPVAPRGRVAMLSNYIDPGQNLSRVQIRTNGPPLPT